MVWLSETAATLGLDVGSTIARPRHALLVAFGLLVAGTTLALLLTIPAGIKRVVGKTGSAEIAMVLPSGAATESSATFSATRISLIGALPGVARAPDGRALVAPQFVADTRLVRPDGSTATVLVRGVTPIFWDVVGRSAALTMGHRFQAGRNQVVAGVAAARSFVSLDTGDVVRIREQPWQVTGQFSAGGGFWESQLWTGMAVLQSAYHAEGQVSVAWVRLESPAASTRFSRALHEDPRTQGLSVEAQRDYYASQTAFLESFIHVAAAAAAIALGSGAILAAVNALTMGLEARRRDLAVLRAVGFRRGALAAALVLEVLIIAAMCAGVAVLISWVAVDGREVGSSTLDSAIQFKLRVDAGVAGWTFIYVLLIAGLSALWPVAHTVTAPLAAALHDA